MALADLLRALEQDAEARIAEVRQCVLGLTERFPLYRWRRG